MITLLNNGQNVVGRVFRRPGDPVIKNWFTVPINGNDTISFILHPNITNIDLIRKADFEVRGCAEISLSSVSTPKTTQILVMPEHRGTFSGSLDPSASESERSKLGEVAYALPTATGGSLFELTREI